MQFCPDFAVLWQSSRIAGKIAAIPISAITNATKWDCRNTPDFLAHVGVLQKYYF